MDYNSLFYCLSIFEGKARLQNYNIELLESLDATQAIELKIDTNKTPFKNIRISVISFSGEVLYDNLLPYESLENHEKRPEIISANRNGKGYHIARQSESDGKEYFYSATKGKNFIIRTAVPYSNALIESLKADLSFLWVMIVVGIVMSVIAYFITHRLGKTIERLNLFAEKAKKYELLLVPSDSFGLGGYVRISYCVSTKQIENSLPAFKALIEEYK